MIRLFANANYDFIKWRRWAFSVTGGIMLVGLAFLVTRGLNYSIEFTGGTLIQVESAKRVETGLIRRSLDDVGLHGAHHIDPRVPIWGLDKAEPRIRATAGEEIIAHAGTLAPKKECSFWAQAVAVEGLETGNRDFDFVVKTTQV